MTTDEPKPRLRDRKRERTWARIEAAAVELVLQDGLDAATIDAISERADISPRTFFNYFDSKDAAVLGMRPHHADEEVIAEQSAIADDLDPVVAVVRLVMATMSITENVDAGLHRGRLEIIRRHPEIVGTQFAQLNARKERLAEYVAQILERRSPLAGDEGIDGRAQGDIVLALCASAVRTAVLSWAKTTGSNIHEQHDAGTYDVEVIGRRAVELVHNTLRRLA